VLDFVLAAIALGCLAYALLGVANVATALRDLNAMNLVCADGGCAHHGVLTAHSFIGSGGRRTNYCILTVDLDVGTRQAVVIGSTCDGLTDGSRVDAEIWKGTIVAVTTSGGTIGTVEHPSVGVFIGLYRMLALVPFALFVAMIHIDIANHHVVRKVWSLGRS